MAAAAYTPPGEEWREQCRTGGDVNLCQQSLEWKVGYTCDGRPDFLNHQGFVNNYARIIGSGYGAQGFIDGLEGRGVHSIEELMRRDDGSDNRMWYTWITGQVMWFVFAVVWVLLLIGAIFWSIALCSSGYRACCSKGCEDTKCKCCSPCCGEWPEMGKAHSKSMIAGIVILGVYFIPWFVLSVLQTKYAINEVQDLDCVFMATGYDVMFTSDTSVVVTGGSKRWSEDIESLKDPIEDPAWKADANFLLGQGQTDIKDQVDVFTTFEKHLVETKTNLAKSVNFDFWTTSGSPPPATVPYGSACFGCEEYDPTKIDLDAIKTTMLIQSNTFAAQMMTHATTEFPQYVNSIDGASSYLKLDEEHDSLIELLEAIDDPATFNQASSLFHILWVFPAIGIILMVFYIPLLFTLNYKQNKNMNAAMCVLFAILGLILLVGGIWGLVFAQAPAEMCHMARVDLFTNNRYWDYKAIADRIDRTTYEGFVTTCLTYDGQKQPDGLWGEVVKEYPKMNDYDQFAYAMRSENAEFLKESADKVSDIQRSTLYPLQNVYVDQGLLNMVYTDVQQSMPTDADYNPRTYAMFADSLYGTLSTVVEPLDRASEALAKSMQTLATAAIADTDFKADQNATAYPSSDFTNFIQPTRFGDLANELANINRQLEDFSCNIGVCHTVGCCTNLGTASCVVFNGSKLISIQPDTDVKQFWLTETLADPLNKGDISALMTCLTNAFTVNAGKGPAIISTINSLNAYSKRVRVLQAQDIFTMYDDPVVGDPTKNLVEFTDYNERSSVAWSNLYDLSGPTKVFTDKLSSSNKRITKMINRFTLGRMLVECNTMFTRIDSVQDYGCQGVTANVGMTCLWWTLMALGCLGMTIYTWVRYGWYKAAISEGAKADFEEGVVATGKSTPVPLQTRPSEWVHMETGIGTAVVSRDVEAVAEGWQGVGHRVELEQQAE